jgi:antitoxin MazE
MKTRVQKWGNSLGVRIPRSFAVEAGLEYDATVDVSFVNDALVIRLEPSSKPTLKQLLARVTDENLHHEVDTGAPVGNETW